MAFNTAERWSRDLSEDIADEIARRCAMDGFDGPPFLEGFVDRYGAGRHSFLCRFGARPSGLVWYLLKAVPHACTRLGRGLPFV